MIHRIASLIDQVVPGVLLLLFALGSIGFALWPTAIQRGTGAVVAALAWWIWHERRKA